MNTKQEKQMERNVSLPRYVVMTSSCRMPSSCWGRYGNVAVVELAPGTTKMPSRIDERFKSIKSIRHYWDRLHVGKTQRGEFQQALAEAEQIVKELNEQEGDKDE